MPRPKTISDDRLLEISRQRFLADGVGASTRTIAADAGVSEGILFQRFGTKEELFFRAMRMPAPNLDVALAAATPDRSQRESLHILGMAVLAYLREAMPIILMVFSHPAREERLQQGSDQAHQFLGEAAGLHQAFRQVLGVRGADSPLQPAMVGVLVSVLLARAIHEQIGFVDQAETETWLSSTLDALEEGLSLAR